MLRFHFARLCIPKLENEYDYGCIWFRKDGCKGMDTGVDICNQYTLRYTCQDCMHEPYGDTVRSTRTVRNFRGEPD